MKNFKLLLASTAILSTGVIVANAGEISATLHAKAAFSSSFDIEETRELSFGHILNPTAGQSLTVAADGSVSGSLSTISTTASNIDDSIHHGIIKIEQALNNSTLIGNLRITITPFKLYTNKTHNSCGTVTILTNAGDRYEAEGTGKAVTYYPYGGTLTLTAEDVSNINSSDGSYDIDGEDIGPSTHGIRCSGSGTATFILDENYG